MENLLEIDKLFQDLESKEDKFRYEAFKKLITKTDVEVDWIYDKWFSLVDRLSSENSFQRSIGIMLIANICKSDKEDRILDILDKCLPLINDEKFITSRQSIQCFWKIGIKNKAIEKRIINELENSYFENIHLIKHSNLIKQDVISCLFNIYKYTNEKNTIILIDKLINSETDEKLIKILRKLISKK